jgi:hypothetical protein
MAAILCDIQPGDEVIAPSYTFVSTVNAFILRGAKIVFCDSREDHPGIDENKIKAPTEIDLTEAFYVQLAARKVPSGSTVEWAVAEAKKNPPPPEAGIYAEDEPRHLLVCVCYWLSTLKSNRRFYLSCHDAAKHLGFHKHSKWALIFKGLCKQFKPTPAVLRLISKGGCFADGKKASE